MNTGPLGSTPSSPTKPENQTEFPFNRPAEGGQPQQYAHYTGPTAGGWTAPVAPPASPPPSLSSQYPHHASLVSQTPQWGHPSSPPPTSCGSTANAGNPGAPSSSPYQPPPPSSCLGMSLQPQPAHSEHGATPSNTSSYPVVQSSWQSPPLATSNYAGLQQNQGQNPPDQPVTLYGQSHPGHVGTSYAPPPGPPQPPPHPGTSGSGPQTQPDPNIPNKRTSYTISQGPVLIRFGTCADSSLCFACSHISLGLRFLLRLFATD